MLMVLNTFDKGRGQQLRMLIIGGDAVVKMVPDEAEVAVPGSP